MEHQLPDYSTDPLRFNSAHKHGYMVSVQREDFRILRFRTAEPAQTLFMGLSWQLNNSRLSHRRYRQRDVRIVERLSDLPPNRSLVLRYDRGRCAV